MVTIAARSIVGTDVVYKYNGKSTDEKPISTNGSCFVEMDTGKEYFFDGDEHGWSERADKYLDSITIETAPTKTTYYVGDAFDATGAVVKAIYTDESNAVVEFTVDAPEKLALDSEVALVYSENGRTRKAPVAIEIKSNEATDKASFMEIAQNGSEVVLDADIAITSTLSFKKPFVLDLNGHELSTNTSNNYMMKVEGGDLTIKGGDLKAKKRIGTVSNGGKLTIEDGEFISTNDLCFDADGEGCKITVNGGKFTAVEGGVVVFHKAELEINGGEFYISDNFAVATNGKDGYGGNIITINDIYIETTITSEGYEACGIYIPNDDTFVMNGGKIVVHGGCGLLMRAGNVTINGGYIKAETGANVPGHVGDSTTNVGASAVIYQESADYPAKEGMSLTINGGTFIGTEKGLEVLSNEVEPQVFVNGGAFIPPYVPAD